MRAHLISRAGRTTAVLATGAALAVGALAAQPAAATAGDESLCESTATMDPILYSLSPDRSGALSLDGEDFTGSEKPFIFLSTTAASDTEVRFYLDDVDDGITDCSLNPRIDRSGGTIPGQSTVAYDFFGGNTRKATGFSISQLDPGTYTITTHRITGTVETWSVATFTVGLEPQT